MTMHCPPCCTAQQPLSTVQCIPSRHAGGAGQSRLCLTGVRCYMQRQKVAENISKNYLSNYQQLRASLGSKDGGVAHPGALIFDSTMGNRPMQPFGAQEKGATWVADIPEAVSRPQSDTELCFMTV